VLAEAPLDDESLRRELDSLFGEASGAVLTDVGSVGPAYATA